MESVAKSAHPEVVQAERSKLEVEMAELRERLTRSEGKVVELEIANKSLKTARNEAIACRIVVQEELAYCKSENYKENIINDYKSFAEYNEKIGREAGSYLDKGCVHIICQLHHHCEDKSILLRAFEANFDNEVCRRGADFVPYTTEEMDALREKDQRRGRVEWTLPPPSHPKGVGRRLLCTSSLDF